jgi:chromosome segregation ATPase
MTNRLNIKTVDDYILVDNFEEFKLQLETQRQYCIETQHEIKQVNEKLQKKNKKYQKQKLEIELLKQKIIELERENQNLRTNLDCYQRFLIPQTFQQNLIQMNQPTLNNIDPVFFQQSYIPPPPPPPPINKSKLLTNDKLPSGMDLVLQELTKRFNNIKN